MDVQLKESGFELEMTKSLSVDGGFEAEPGPALNFAHHATNK